MSSGVSSLFDPGTPVRVKTTDGETYYGTLEGADQQGVAVKDATVWYEGYGRQWHGDIFIGAGSIRSVDRDNRPQDNDPAKSRHNANSGATP